MNIAPSVNGSSPEPSSNGHAPPGAPGDLRWDVAYDRASVERFVAEVDAERLRLQEAIDAARARVARARATTREAPMQPGLSDLLRAAHGELVELEREHRATLKAIGTAALEEATRLLTAARDEVSAARAMATSMPAREADSLSVEDLLRDIDLRVARSAGDRFA